MNMDDQKPIGEENESTGIRTPLVEFIRKFKKQKSALAASSFILLLVVLAVICYQISPYQINQYSYDSILTGPSFRHLFGTDEFGRDIFSRVLCGTQISLTVGLISVTAAAAVGTFLGLIGGYYGGILDGIIMRIGDTLFAFPGLILAIAIVAILGPGLYNVVIAVAVFGTPTFARLVRSSTLQLKGSVYVMAAKNLGASDFRVLAKYILPGAVPNIIIQYTMSIGTSILTASGLSFLGMGASAPTPEWGLMLSNGRNYMSTAPHVAIFPGLAIFLTVLSFNLLGDGLRDALDPKLSD